MAVRRSSRIAVSIVWANIFAMPRSVKDMESHLDGVGFPILF
jgi:hypothetical protein